MHYITFNSALSNEVEFKGFGTGAEHENQSVTNARVLEQMLSLQSVCHEFCLLKYVSGSTSRTNKPAIKLLGVAL